MRRVVFITLLVAALLGACSKDDAKDETDQGSTSTGVATQVSRPTVVASRWDASTVFQYGFGVPNDAWQQACGKSAAAIGARDPCILQVMKLANAGQSAVAFYEKQTYFLASFKEAGRVDYGQGGAPWINMGRPTPQLFLNGLPDVIEAPLPQDFKTNASYADLLRREPNAFPWTEYGQLTQTASEASGQRFVIEYPLRICRACPDVGGLPIAYSLDTQGRLTKTETLALKAQ